MSRTAVAMNLQLTCTAIMAVRNEAAHIRRVLEDFSTQGIDVVVIDHGSTDNTIDICREFIGRGLLSIETLPWHGFFDLTSQLVAKEAIIRNLTHDWVIHVDADEWLQSPVEGESLLDGIRRVAQMGYNVLNFEEFVFLPPVRVADIPSEYHKKFLHYYFFSPSENRLMRAWKRESGLTNVRSGGHRLSGSDVNLAPESFILRHYMVLSQQHAIGKYIARKHSQDDITRGWHRNRLNLETKALELPDSGQLKRLPRWDSVDFDRSAPKCKHFWEW